MVATLAKLVGKLIERFVGKESTPALSQAIVDAGMKLISLEAPEQEEKAGPHAIASTIEEVARRVSEASDEVLDDSRLLEAEVIDAFGAAASAHFPQEMLHEDRRERDGRRHLDALPEGWVQEVHPNLRGGDHARSGALHPDVRRDHAGRFSEGSPQRSRCRSRRARTSTKRSPGRGSARSLARRRASRARPSDERQPRSVSSALEAERGRALERAGPRARRGWKVHVQPSRGRGGAALVLPRDPGGASRGRASQSRGRDGRFPEGRAQAGALLERTRGSGIAARLNSGGGIPTILVALKEVLSSGVKAALSGNLQGRVRIVHEAVDQQGFLGAALKRVGGIVLEKFAEKVVEWSLKALADELQKGAAAFVAATQDQADGVTVRIVLRSPPGFAALRAALKGKSLRSWIEQPLQGRPHAFGTGRRRLHDESGGVAPVSGEASDFARGATRWSACRTSTIFAAPAAWASLERYLGTTLRGRLTESVGDLESRLRYLETLSESTDYAALAELRRLLSAFRASFLRVETALDFYGDAVNTRSSAKLAALLGAAISSLRRAWSRSSCRSVTRAAGAELRGPRARCFRAARRAAAVGRHHLEPRRGDQGDATQPVAPDVADPRSRAPGGPSDGVGTRLWPPA